ncbi:MAG: deoxyuridine 5'-triphosphate nucleotidohydrolase [Chloroflexota bacterium]|nr:deoxyuridine 5'-triphosphate nucleotidohydrolase [Chloroflexia bacterium]MDQ3225056.1 deoxyuridine 5'-triphosphate nucleotidohydrolase [Chloroflexota bacterium]
MSGASEYSGVGGALGREELLVRIQGTAPLISGFVSLEDQLQPNGFDLSLAEVGQFAGGGAIGRSNANRTLPEVQPIPFDGSGWLDLRPGPYQIIFNETVALPNSLMALGRPRSSLCRAGATIVTAVWDAGYRGRSTALLLVENLAGIRIERDARLMQLVFLTLNEPTIRGYDGAYQGENLPVERPGQSRRA